MVVDFQGYHKHQSFHVEDVYIPFRPMDPYGSVIFYLTYLEDDPI